MTEKGYINATALGKITAAIAVLRELCKENLTHIITDEEWSKVTPTLCDWQERLFQAVKSDDTPNNHSIEDCKQIREQALKDVGYLVNSRVTISKHENLLSTSIIALKSVITVCPQFSNFQPIVDEYENLHTNE